MDRVSTHIQAHKNLIIHISERDIKKHNLICSHWKKKIMNCAFLSTVYSTTLITEAIYIGKMICTTWRVRRWWCEWADFFVASWFPGKAKSSDSWECTSLQDHHWTTDQTMEMVHHNLSQDGEWLNWGYCIGKSLAEPKPLGFIDWWCWYVVAGAYKPSRFFFSHVFTPVEGGEELWLFGEHPINFRWVCG